MTRSWPRVFQIGATLTGLLTLAFWTSPLWWQVDPLTRQAGAIFEVASAVHPLGCDAYGRDLLARLLAGGRLATIVGCGVALIAVGGGAILGVLAGWFGGWVDVVITRSADVALAFPGLLLALLVLFVSERPGIATVVLSLSLTSWAGHARLVRGLVLHCRPREDILAAQLYGASPWVVLTRFVLPSIGGPVAVQATFAAAAAVLGEATLSFLGLGPQGVVSWGAMLTEGVTLFLSSPAAMLWTCAALLLWQAGLVLMADGLRDHLDPLHHGAPSRAALSRGSALR
jgi:peptide/nickel transport system permease protein